MKRFIFIFLFVSTFCYPEYEFIIGSDILGKNFKKGDESFPKTVDEAVKRLIDDLSILSKIKLRVIFNIDLIMFHHDLGMGIRNDFGLWKGNDDLLQDCSKLSNSKKTEPDSCSSIIIHALWKMLNKDILLTDLEKLNPEEYFEYLNNKITENFKTGNLRGFLDFPSWILEDDKFISGKRINNILDFYKEKNPDDYKKFKERYLYSMKNYKIKSDVQHLLFLYLNYISNLFPEKPDILYFEELLENNSSETFDFIVKTKEYSYKNIVPIELKKITMSDISLRCLNLILGKKFQKKEEYIEFKKNINKSELLKDYYYLSFDEKMIDELIKTPQRLLKTIMLTKKVMYFSKFSGIPESDDNEFFKILYDKLNSKVKNFKEKEFPDFLKFERNKKYGLIGEIKIEIKNPYFIYPALQLLLKIIKDDELIKLVLIDENKNYKKYDETYDYINMVIYILIIEHERLFELLGKEKMFEILEYYSIENRFTYEIKYYFIQLMIKYNVEKFQKVYIDDNKFFDKTDKKKDTTFKRSVLKGLLIYHFDKYKDFVKEWISDICDETYYPTQREAVFEILKNGNKKYKDFYNKIINDKHFVKCPGE